MGSFSTLSTCCADFMQSSSPTSFRFSHNCSNSIRLQSFRQNIKHCWNHYCPPRFGNNAAMSPPLLGYGKPYSCVVHRSSPRMAKSRACLASVSDWWGAN